MQRILLRTAAIRRWTGLFLLTLLSLSGVKPSVAQGLIDRGPWSGAMTGTSVVVKAKLSREGLSTRLVASTDSNVGKAMKKEPPQARVSVPVVSSLDDNNVVTLAIDGLQPNTRYFYALEINGELARDKTGEFRTFPIGQSSFDFAFSSSAATGSNKEVFNTIRERNPLFFLNLGDLHYNDITSDNRELYRKAYDAVLASPNQARLYRQVPLVYTWKEHDFAGNGSNKLSAGRDAAREVYREYIAHYPQPEGDDNGPIYQAFSVGRARFIVTDTRSERDPADAPQGPEKSMLGAAQKEWLKHELLAARGKFPVIFLVSSVSWIAGPGDDGWGAYEDERREIANFIKENGITGVCILSSDAHMLAADDGTNSDYATDGGAPIPVFQAGSLDRTASFKGGPYSHGFYGPRKDEGCFGLVHVEDKGSSIEVSFQGLNDRKEERIALSFTAPYIPGGAAPRRGSGPRGNALGGTAAPALPAAPAAPVAVPAPAAPAPPVMTPREEAPREETRRDNTNAATETTDNEATDNTAVPRNGEGSLAPFYVAPQSDGKDAPYSSEATRADDR